MQMRTLHEHIDGLTAREAHPSDMAALRAAADMAEGMESRWDQDNAEKVTRKMALMFAHVAIDIISQAHEREREKATEIDKLKSDTKALRAKLDEERAHSNDRDRQLTQAARAVLEGYAGRALPKTVAGLLDTMGMPR